MKNRLPLGPQLAQRIGLLVMVSLVAGCSPPTTEDSPADSATTQPTIDSTARPLPTEQVTTSASTTPEPGATLAPSPTSRSFPTPSIEAELGDRWRSPADQMNLVYVPAGRFRMGTLANFVGGQPDERPQRSVILPAFWIDETEVTWAMYQRCEQAEACRTLSPDKPDWTGPTHPVVLVNWQDAADYCSWVGRRLPTEAEWEKAARGSQGRRYPWEWIGAPVSSGDVRLNFCDASCPYPFQSKAVDDGFAQTAPVGSFPAGASPYGALDMSGNVWEWTADWYQADRYQDLETDLSKGPVQGTVRVIRGGSWLETAWEGLVLTSRSANRFWNNPELGRPDLGFRCALSSK